MFRLTVLLLVALMLASPAFAQQVKEDGGYELANHLTPQEIAKKALEATVLLIMVDANGQPIGEASGFFVRSNLIATNNHVIHKAVDAFAKRVGDDTEFDIEGVIATDMKHNLAILRCSDSSIMPLHLGDSDSVKIGDVVHVAGNPEGFEGTFSGGIISGILGSDASNDKLLQIAATISPCSSGGPVLDSSGKVIGVAISSVMAEQNLNLVVPSNYLDVLLNSIGKYPLKPLSEGKQSKSAESSFNSGIARHKSGQYDAAVADFDVAIRLRPNFTDAYNNRGVAKHKLGQYDGAVADFDVAIRLRPSFADAYNNRGNAKHDLGQYDAAIADFDVAIRLRPSFTDAYNSRGIAKRELGQFDAAVADFDIAIRLRPDFADAYNNRGNVKGDLGQHDAAVADFDIAIRLRPDFAGAHYNRGNAKGDLGQYDVAVADFDAAIRLRPDFAGAYNNRGIVKGKLGQYDAAIADFDAAIRLRPDSASAYNNRGTAKQYLGHYDAAKADFDTARRLKLKQ